MKLVAIIALTCITWAAQVTPAQSSCFGYETFGLERIKLHDKENGYLRVWKTKDTTWATKDRDRQVIGKLKHGQVIKTLRSIKDRYCGAAVYIRFKNNKNKSSYGWIFSDVLYDFLDPTFN